MRLITKKKLYLCLVFLSKETAHRSPTSSQNQSVLILVLPGVYTGGSWDHSVKFGVLLCTVVEGKWQLIVTKFVFPVNLVLCMSLNQNSSISTFVMLEIKGGPEWIFLFQDITSLRTNYLHFRNMSKYSSFDVISWGCSG